MDSALSRIMIISLDDRDGRRGFKSSGFSTPAPITLEIRLRRVASEAENWSQRMNRRLSPNRFLMRSLWRTARATEVFPMPPGPTRAIGLRPSARSTIFSISSSRPKQALGGGGGNSPGGILWKFQAAITPKRLQTLTCLEPKEHISVLLEKNEKLGLLIDVGHRSPDLPMHFVAYPKGSCGCSIKVLSEREAVS
jgi:hypothetical protein